jgi:hypothetical protein
MEKYLALIKIFNDWNSMTQKQTMCRADLDLTSPKEWLNFLVQHDLIEEKTLETRLFTPSKTRATTVQLFRLRDEDSIFGRTKIKQNRLISPA